MDICPFSKTFGCISERHSYPATFSTPKIYPVSRVTTSLPPALEIRPPINTRNSQNGNSQQRNSNALNNASSIPFASNLPTAMLRRINDARMRTTYQHDFSQSNEYPSMNYDSLMISAGLKDSYLHRNEEEEKEEENCRIPPKLPFLHGHQIPGRMPVKKYLFSYINDENNRRNKQSAIESRKSQLRESRASKLKQQNNAIWKMKKNQNEFKNKIHSSDDDSSQGNNRYSTDVDETTSVKSWSQSTNSSSSTIRKNRYGMDATRKNGNGISTPRNGLDSEEDEKIAIKIRHQNLAYSVDDRTGYNQINSENLLPSSWASEYQDTIGYIGDEIIRHRLHSPKRLKHLAQSNNA